MNDWGFVFGLGLIAATIATIAYVRYRQRESASLRSDAELARGLRDLAGADPVRLAAVEEFEVGVYKRLFYSGVIGPRARSAAWSALGAVLAVSGGLAVEGRDTALAAVTMIVLIALAVILAIAAVVFTALAVIAAATTPRVSFADSYPEAAAADSGPSGAAPSGSARSDSASSGSAQQRSAHEGSARSDSAQRGSAQRGSEPSGSVG